MAAGISKNQRPTSRGNTGTVEIALKNRHEVVNKADVRIKKYLGSRGLEAEDAASLAGVVPPFGSSTEPLEFIAIPGEVYDRYKDEMEPVPYARVLSDAKAETLVAA